jgi:hypothetical protein
MAIKSVNNLPFSTYVVKNEVTDNVHVYMGIASRSNNANKTDYFPHQVVACKTTYLFASLVGTRNVKITRPTTQDPYIYVQTRAVDPQTCSGYEPTSLKYSGDMGGITLRTIKTDPTITIEDHGCNYGFTTFRYYVQNACSMNGVYYGTIGVPGESNVIWQFKSIVPGSCILMEDNGCRLKFSFDRESCCPC